MTSFTQRLIGAAKLNVQIYEEVEADTTAMAQAMGVVALSSVAAGIGAIGQQGVAGLFAGLVAALLGWLLWAGLTYFIGTRILPTPQTHADSLLSKLDSGYGNLDSMQAESPQSVPGVGRQKPLKQAFWGNRSLTEGGLRRAA